MTFEQRTAAMPAEPAPMPSGQPGAPDGPTPIQLRLQILSTEHWSLLASRSLAWNESFTRASMYLSTLSASIVALGLIAGVSGFGDAFFVFALVILPVDLFVGVGTWIRMGAANYHDAVTVLGMNRIRAAYVQMAPDLEPYFVMGLHDDPVGIRVTMAIPPETPLVAHLIAATPFLVMVLNAVVTGAIAALVALQFLSASPAVALAAAFVSALLVMVAEVRIGSRNIRRGQEMVRPMFPTPAKSRRET